MDHPQIRRVLILGHTGYIGSHLLAYFQQQAPEIEILGQSVSTVDLTQAEQAATLAGMLDAQTAVIVCAAIKKQLGDNLDTLSQNLQIAANLCRLLEKQPVARLVLFSSAAVYGEDVHNTHITEETPVQPNSYYGIGKFTTERLLRKVISQHGSSSLLTLRPALVYGPAEAGTFYGPSGFLKTALRGEAITLWGDGTEKREFVYIANLVEATYRLTFHSYSGIVNMVSGTSYSYTDALKIISELVPHPLQINSRPRSKPQVDHGFDNQLLRDLLPDLTFTDLSKGLRQVFETESQPLSNFQN
jgi:UDP-glucose 4-epimerase